MTSNDDLKQQPYNELPELSLMSVFLNKALKEANRMYIVHGNNLSKQMKPFNEALVAHLLLKIKLLCASLGFFVDLLDMSNVMQKKGCERLLNYCRNVL